MYKYIYIYMYITEITLCQNQVQKLRYFSHSIKNKVTVHPKVRTTWTSLLSIHQHGSAAAER